MKEPAGTKPAGLLADADANGLEALLDSIGTPDRSTGTHVGGVVVGTLVAFAENGHVPLVTYAGQPGTAALPARATLDLHGAHVGRPVVLVFEGGEPRRPIVMGCLREAAAGPLPDVPGQVEVDADGERLVVTARRQMVLRCGKASITLTKAGKVLIEGAYVSSRSSGTLRLKGGSVQIN